MATVTFERAVEALQAHLGEKAFAHSMRVADTACELALAYGVDSESARLAGLLHDWDRELDGAELVNAATAAGISVSEADREVPYLLHARTGAAAAREAMPGLSDEIVSAIERHTVGAADMSPLDMVVYLADMLEPARHYPGVAELRDHVGEVGLGELFAEGYQHSVAHLVAKRRRIHPDTVAVWNSLVAGGAR
jgi:predicted HD superfamily hydrolase involved in NAD metabolism